MNSRSVNSFSPTVVERVSDECKLPIPHSVFKQCSECPLAAATHDQTLLQNDTIAVISINVCGKSFHIIHNSLSARQF